MKSNTEHDFGLELECVLRLICKTCHNISDAEVCSICPKAAKRTQAYLCSGRIFSRRLGNRKYQSISWKIIPVLGGVISPIQGIGPEDFKDYRWLSRLRSCDKTPLF